VQVIGGAFAHCFGLCEGMKDRERIAILLELLGRKVRVVLELDSVVAA
jgi:transcriptional antiterminator RfaH